VFGGERNEIHICITEEMKPRMGWQFWSSVGGRFQAFRNHFLFGCPSSVVDSLRYYIETVNSMYETNYSHCIVSYDKHY
jgi:hypothetical protein